MVAPFHYSIYKNKVIKFTVHLLFWMGVFWLMCLVNAMVFREELLSIITISYSLFTLPLVIIGHYLIVHFLIDQFRISRFLFGCGLWLSWYISAVFVNIKLFLELSNIYAQNYYLSALYQFYKIQNFYELFSYHSFKGMFSTVIVYNIIAIGIKISVNFYETRREELRVVEERTRMESIFLRNKMSPRFFLEILNELQHDLPRAHKANTAIDRLSQLIQFTIYDLNREWIQLREEIDFLNNYIALELMRHRDNRVKFRFDTSNVSDRTKLIRPLLLINFVENAFKHGVNSSVRKGYVHLNLEEMNDVLTFRVTNNKNVQLADNSATKKNGGIGLTNVKRRLQLEYPDRHTLNIKETDEKYEIELTIKI